MTVTEQRRQGLAVRANEVFGTEHGSTFMELISPPPWDDVATKADLVLLRSDVRAEMAVLRTEMAVLRADMAELRVELRTEVAQLRTEMAELRTELRTEMAELRTEFRTGLADLEARLQRSIVTWLLTGMGIQTAVVGVLIGLR